MGSIKYKILIVEDDKWWDEIYRLKQIGYVPFTGKFKGLEIKVIHEISELDTAIAEFKPDLISFNAVTICDSWLAKIKKFKGKHFKIVLACYEPPLFRVQKLLSIGIFDIFWTLKPKELVYWYRRVLTDKEMPLSYGTCPMYWDARAEGLE